MPVDSPARPGRTSWLALALIALAAYAAGGATLWYWLANRRPPEAESAPDHPPATGNVIVALGRLRPAKKELTLAGPVGDQIATLSAAPGQAVKQGDVLVRLASHIDREAEVAILEQQLESARQQRPIALANAALDVKLAEAKIRELETVAPLEIKAQEARLGVLKQKREADAQRLATMRDLQKSSPNTVPGQELEAQRLLLAQTEADLQSASVQLDKAQKAHASALEVARLQLDAARANLARTEKDTTIESLEKKLALARLQLDRTSLRAPWPGRVLKVMGVEGQPTAPQQPILQLADTSRMVALAEVYETDVKALRGWKAAKATVRSRALPHDLTGAVRADQVSDVISRNTVFDIDPAADADRRVFEVPVELNESDVAARFINLQVHVFLEPAR